MFKFVVLAAFVATAAAVDIPWGSCGAGFQEPASFAIPECPGLPCSLPIGADIILNIGINVNRVTTELPVTATVTQNGVTNPWVLPTGNACYGISGLCPITAGTHLITFPVTISEVSSGVPAVVRVEINNDLGESVACGTIETTFN